MSQYDVGHAIAAGVNAYAGVVAEVVYVALVLLDDVALAGVENVGLCEGRAAVEEGAGRGAPLSEVGSDWHHADETDADVAWDGGQFDEELEIVDAELVVVEMPGVEAQARAEKFEDAVAGPPG